VEEFDNKENLISQAKTSNDDFAGAKDTGYRGVKSIVPENEAEPLPDKFQEEIS
jgi:hypothetical protein